MKTQRRAVDEVACESCGLIRPGAQQGHSLSRLAFEELRARYPRYRVDERGLRRVHMANVAGFSHVPVAVDGRG